MEFPIWKIFSSASCQRQISGFNNSWRARQIDAKSHRLTFDISTAASGKIALKVEFRNVCLTLRSTCVRVWVRVRNVNRIQSGIATQAAKGNLNEIENSRIGREFANINQLTAPPPRRSILKFNKRCEYKKLCLNFPTQCASLAVKPCANIFDGRIIVYSVNSFGWGRERALKEFNFRHLVVDERCNHQRFHVLLLSVSRNIETLQLARSVGVSFSLGREREEVFEFLSLRNKAGSGKWRA